MVWRRSDAIGGEAILAAGYYHLTLARVFLFFCCATKARAIGLRLPTDGRADRSLSTTN